MLKTIHSEPKQSFFAPEWSFDVFEVQLDTGFATRFRDLILYKEPIMLQEMASLEGMQAYGHAQNSTTSKFMYYNIFDWKEEPAREFKQHVIEQHKAFRKAVGARGKQKVYARSWVNVLRKGEFIPPHMHSSPIYPTSYLSGHLTLQASDTRTHYGFSDQLTGNHPVYSVNNKPGLMSFMSSQVMHWTDTNSSDEPRITVAFDLHIHPGGGVSGVNMFPHSPNVEL